MQVPGKWNFLIGDPDAETPLGKMPKGTLEVTVSEYLSNWYILFAFSLVDLGFNRVP